TYRPSRLTAGASSAIKGASAALPLFAETSPPRFETRSVLGVQFASWRQVSRTIICLTTLPGADAALADIPFPALAAGLGVSATNARYLPESLTEGRTAAKPESLPNSSTEASWVLALHDSLAPLQVSRK